MRQFFLILIISSCLFLCSCSTNYEPIVRTLAEFDIQTNHSKTVIVSDAGKKYGKDFGKSFLSSIETLAQKSPKEVSVMSYIEFIRSDYNNPAEKSSHPDTVFVFIVARSCNSPYDTWTCARYLIDVKRLDGPPFISQEITLRLVHHLIDSRSERGEELAGAVFKELNKHNIL